MKERCNCYGCRYLVHENGWIAWRCRHERTVTNGLPDKCKYSRENMTDKIAERILHDYQKYRRGKGTLVDCPSPYLIGIAIDHAIRRMRHG